MVCPTLKFATTFAKDPKVVTAAGVVIVSSIKLWEDVTNHPKERDPDLDWLSENDVLKKIKDDCFEAYKNCIGTEDQCDEELVTCLQPLQDYH